MRVEYKRGDVVEAVDVFNEGQSSRPFVIVNTTDHPFHGEQYVALTLTTRTWYEETIPVSSEDFVDGGLPRKSFIVPWGVTSPQQSDIETYLGRVSSVVVDDAVRALFDYLFEGNRKDQSK